MKHSAIEDIIKSLVAARKAKGLTQSEMARRLGVPQSYISRMESGRLDMRLSSLVDVARYLNQEIVLVPNTVVPTVQTLLRSKDSHIENRPLYTLDDLDDSPEDSVD